MGYARERGGEIVMYDIERKMMQFMLDQKRKKKIRKEEKEWHMKRTKREFFPEMW